MIHKYRFKGHVDSVNDLPHIDCKTVRSGDLYSVGQGNEMWVVDYSNPPTYERMPDDSVAEIIRNTLDNSGVTLSETFKQALQLMTYICAIAAQVDAYPQVSRWSGWSDEFSREEIHRAFKGMERHLCKTIPWNDEEVFGKDFWDRVFAFPIAEKELLGFRRYSKESGDKRLVPLWVIQCLPPGYKIKGTKINSDEPVNISHDMKDKDVRCGCVAYLI